MNIHDLRNRQKDVKVSNNVNPDKINWKPWIIGMAAASALTLGTVTGVKVVNAYENNNSKEPVPVVQKEVYAQPKVSESQISSTLKELIKRTPFGGRDNNIYKQPPQKVVQSQPEQRVKSQPTLENKFSIQFGESNTQDNNANNYSTNNINKSLKSNYGRMKSPQEHARIKASRGHGRISRNKNLESQIANYSVNDTIKLAGDAVNNLVAEKRYCNSLKFDVNESYGKNLGDTAENVLRIFNDVQDARGKWNRTKNKQTREINRNSDRRYWNQRGTRVTSFPKLNRSPRYVGEIFEDINSMRTKDQVISYLDNRIKEIDTNIGYVKNNLSLIKSGEVDLEYIANVQMINAEYGNVSSSRKGKLRYNGRSFRR